jgi:N-methylhydantoinase A
LVFHGFTIATNAWLTRTGARVALLVTRGFKDILEIGSQRRPSTYDLAATKPVPLVAGSQVLEVDERIDAFGEVVTALRAETIDQLVTQATQLKPQSIAISLLFSWANPAHERELATALAKALANVPVYCSSIVNPEIQEFPRANTTAAAAYVGPPVSRYTQALEHDLLELGVRTPLYYMRSDGGASTAVAARENPTSMLLSGPAGGVVAALATAQHTNTPNIVTFDMGGTSADFSVIRSSGATLIRSGVVDGLPLRVPMLDIKAISAGGGSIAWVDRGGALRVGPDSSGACPGPACYGLGGTAATLSDAAVVLGFLASDRFAGGDIQLDRTLAERAVTEHVATPLGLSTTEAALGMFAVATANMAQAIRELSTERGDDIGEFALLAFGGAGGLFAPFLLRELGLNKILVPRYPGVFAALGLQYADLRHQRQAPFPSSLDVLDHQALSGLCAELRHSINEALERDGVDIEKRHFRYSADMRYIGQHHQLEVELPVDLSAYTTTSAQLSADFHRLHQQRFGYHHEASLVEITSIHVAGTGELRKPASRTDASAQKSSSKPISRQVPLGMAQAMCDASIISRDDLRDGHRVDGPAIVTQDDSTLLVLEGQQGYVDVHGYIHVSDTSAAPEHVGDGE